MNNKDSIFEEVSSIAKAFLMVLVIVLLICFANPKIIKEDKVEVQATITDVDRSPAIITQYVKKMTDYDIYFEYEGVKGSWDITAEEYAQYKDKEGELLDCYLITRTYENGKCEVVLKAVDDK